MTRPPHVSLRPTSLADVPLLFAFELEAAGNERAGAKPRSWDAFEKRWSEILADPVAARVTPRVILADGLLVGAVNIAPYEGADSIGYWLTQDHWGRGIATRAVALMLAEYSRRPLYARAAAFNTPSLRVLEKNGFRVLARGWTPETDRSIAREAVCLVLEGPASDDKTARR